MELLLIDRRKIVGKVGFWRVEGGGREYVRNKNKFNIFVGKRLNFIFRSIFLILILNILNIIQFQLEFVIVDILFNLRNVRLNRKCEQYVWLIIIRWLFIYRDTENLSVFKGIKLVIGIFIRVYIKQCFFYQVFIIYRIVIGFYEKLKRSKDVYKRYVFYIQIIFQVIWK